MELGKLMISVKDKVGTFKLEFSKKKQVWRCYYKFGRDMRYCEGETPRLAINSVVVELTKEEL